MKGPTKMNAVTCRHILGQGMTEYIIIVALIAVASIGAVSAFGGVVKDSFSGMSQALINEAPEAVTVTTPNAGATNGTLGTFK
jgi:Flp pilus assembly pilin Flp